ncbi:HNH endonuclease [Nocardioides panacisoli]|uniref:HNH endonuclease signature motif containing protein n=1 Tax=Nocardioides panacisoli TaxID=627624 RepID=A0ABP7HYS9_9ACTN
MEGQPLDLDEVRERLVHDGVPADDTARIDEIRLLEQLKCAAEARQARIASAFDASQRRRAADQGVPADRQGRGVAHQVAFARRVSPNRGMRLLGLAKVLPEMPHLAAAFAEGRVTEWRVTQLLKETACLTLEHRQEVDQRLCADADELERTGDRQLLGRARALAAELDAKAAAEARAKAENNRRVTLRPAPDTMTYLTGLLPVKDGVAALASLRAAAQQKVSAGEMTSISQAMADVLVERVTGRAPGSGVPVTIDLVMTDNALLDGSDDTAYLDENGPIPADLARAIVAGNVDAGLRTWIRRLYTAPSSGELVSMDSRQRLFPALLAKMITLRDQYCRNPWCNSRIKHTDHVRPHHEDGATSAENGQGLCESCNHAKQAPGWSAEVFDAHSHTVATTTPTGHTYLSQAPPLVRVAPDNLRYVERRHTSPIKLELDLYYEPA